VISRQSSDRRPRAFVQDLAVGVSGAAEPSEHEKNDDKGGPLTSPSSRALRSAGRRICRWSAAGCRRPRRTAGSSCRPCRSPVSSPALIVTGAARAHQRSGFTLSPSDARAIISSRRACSGPSCRCSESRVCDADATTCSARAFRTSWYTSSDGLTGRARVSAGAEQRAKGRTLLARIAHAQRDREHRCVLARLRRTLRDVRERRVARVAEERDAAVDPRRERLVDAQVPLGDRVAVDHAQELVQARAPAAVEVVHELARAVRRPRLDDVRPRRVHEHHVVQLMCADRVRHRVSAAVDSRSAPRRGARNSSRRTYGPIQRMPSGSSMSFISSGSFCSTNFSRGITIPRCT
jgi:hypothetical protein